MLKRMARGFLQAWKLPRWRLALLTAALSDALGFGVVLLPPVQWSLDAVTVVVLFVLLGRRWQLLPALAVEVVPGLQLFPAWTLVVAALASTETAKPNHAVNGALEQGSDVVTERLVQAGGGIPKPHIGAEND